MYEKTTPRMREELIKLRPYTRYLIDEIPGRIRADLTKFAIARYHAVNRSLKPVAAKKERKPRGSKAIKA